MVKQKGGPRFPKLTPHNSIISPFQQGLENFRQGDYDQAINTWQSLPLDSPEKNPALAEAHFRRALLNEQSISQRQADLEAAHRLAPQDGRFVYHLGLLLHAQGRLPEATSAYAQAGGLGFSPRRLEPVRGLAVIERNPGAAWQESDGLSDLECARLYPVACLLQNKPQFVLEPQSADQTAALENLKRFPSVWNLWKGLAELDLGQMEKAVQSLAPSRHGEPLPPEAEAIRAVYFSRLLIAQGREQQALSELENAARRSHFAPLRKMLASLAAQRIREMIAAGQIDAAQKELSRILPLALEEKSLIACQLVAANRQAGASAGQGKWPEAIRHWSSMRAILVEHPDLGPLGPVLHNLAIAYETQEEWDRAGEMWTELLGGLPRRPNQKTGKRLPPTSPLAALPLEQAKDWLRKRIVQCYQKSGNPGKAIEIYRKTARLNPEDLGQRMGLVGALLANDQWVAARNELGRILDLAPHYVPAHVTLAHVYREDGYQNDAERELRKALEIDPASEEAHRELISLLIEFGNDTLYWDAKTALIRFEEVLQFQPGNVEVLALAGRAARETGDSKRAQKWFDQALSAETINAYGNVFTAYLNLNDLESIRRLLERFEASLVQQKEAFYSLAGTMALDKPPEELAGLLPIARRLNPKKSKAAQDREDLGRELLNRALALTAGPARIEMLANLVDTIAPLRPDVAIGYAEAWVGAAPEDLEAQINLGLLQALNDQIEPAKNTLRNAENEARKRRDHALVKRIHELRGSLTGPEMQLIGPLARLQKSLGNLDEDELQGFLGDILGELDDKEHPFK
jgi:tetratricopeptide (TPR) repeat protein